MNTLTVTLNDKTKTASCKETVALCAKYALTVYPALEVDEEQTETVDGVVTSTVKGYLVLHRRFVGRMPPEGEVRYIGGQQVADQNYQWDSNEVYGYAELTTRQIDGVWVTTGELDLRGEALCKDFVQKFGTGATAPLRFAVYDPIAGGLAGEGEFDVKVVEPYYITEDQSLVLFKGEKGEDGDKGDQGDQGMPAYLSYVKEPGASNRWHKIAVGTNTHGDKTLTVEQEGIVVPEEATQTQYVLQAMLYSEAAQAGARDAGAYAQTAYGNATAAADSATAARQDAAHAADKAAAASDSATEASDSAAEAATSAAAAADSASQAATAASTTAQDIISQVWGSSFGIFTGVIGWIKPGTATGNQVITVPAKNTSYKVLVVASPVNSITIYSSGSSTEKDIAAGSSAYVLRTSNDNQLITLRCKGGASSAEFLYLVFLAPPQDQSS